MIRLDPHREPRWFELLPGVRVRVAPLTTAVMMAARRDPEVQEAKGADLELAAGKALARLTVLEWEGVGDAEGEALPVTPEAVGALLDIWDVWLAWTGKVMAGFLEMESEKNVSAPLPNGSSEGAGNTAEPAPEPAPTAPAA